MNKFIGLMIIGSLYSNTVFAVDACSQPVTYLLQGTVAACSGYLFSPDQEKTVRLMKEDYDFLKQEAALKDQQLNEYKAMIQDVKKAETDQQAETKIWKDNSTDITAKYVTSQERQGWRDLIFMGLGVILTVAAGYGLHQASKK